MQRALIGFVFLLPLVFTASGFYLVNPTLGSGVSRHSWRMPLVACGGLSVLLVCLMLGKLVFAQLSHTSAAAQAEIAVMRLREASNLAEVQTLIRSKISERCCYSATYSTRPLFAKLRSSNWHPILI